MTCPFLAIHFNWISILVSALAAFALGGLWYSPLLFAKAWMKVLGITPDKTKAANMKLIFGTTFLLNIFGAFILSAFIGAQPTAIKGLMYGLTISIAFIATSFGISYLYTQKSLKLFLIDAGYYITFYALMGLIIGAIG